LIEDFDGYWDSKYNHWKFVPEAVENMILWYGVNKPEQNRFNEEVQEKAKKFYDNWK
jgi:hypothetical protein